MNLGKVFNLLKQTFKEWSEDKAPRLAAALSYYTIFSLAPLLVIAIAIASLVLDQAEVQTRLLDQIGNLTGAEGAGMIETMIAGQQDQGTDVIASVLGIAALLFGATGVVVQLQDALNTIWDVAPKPDRGLMGVIKDRFFSFAMVLGVGFLLLVSLVVSTALSALGDSLTGLLPGYEILLQVLSFLVSFGFITLLFALIFKYVPDAEIAWRDIWLGAAVTALLFTIGEWAIGFYLGNTDVASAYGAAGSLIILLLWVYYSAQILFFGAEFTQVYANQYGSRVVPADDAVPLTEEARIAQGMPRKETVEAASVEGTSVEEAQRTVGPQSAPRRKAEPDLLPQPQPSLLIFSAVLTALAGFISGMVIKRGGGSKR